jgi:hypothetical protein
MCPFGTVLVVVVVVVVVRYGTAMLPVLEALSKERT